MAIGSHIIPRFYLEQFATPSERRKGPGHVWVYQKNKKPHYRATTVQGYENGYFALIRPDGKVDESLETKLEKLEEGCLDTLVLAKSILFDLHSASRRNALAFYSAKLFCRATQRRNRTQQMYAGMQAEFSALARDNAWINETAQEYISKHGKSIKPGKIKKRLLELSAMMRGQTAVRNNFVEELIVSTEPIKALLLEKPWQIWRAPSDAEFVTSDNPLITFLPFGNGELNPGHGFRKEGVVAAFPLAPCACLAMGVKGPDSVTLDAGRVLKINETIGRLCDKFVYSKTYSDDAKQLVDTYGNSAKYGETAFLPLGLQIPTAKNFVRQSLGLE